MLSKINRLKSDKDFKNVFKNGRTLENRFFRVKLLKNEKDCCRFGFVISAKTLSKATLRNMLKRRLRSAVRLLMKDSKPGLDIVIWPKKISASINYKDLIGHLSELINNKK